MAKNTEQTINDVLGDVLRSKHPRWKEKLFSERTGMFKEGAGMRPDIVILHPGGLPVIIETEIEPARTVEKDAVSRLRRTLTSDGRKIEQAIAMILPEHLTSVSQDKLYSTIEQSEYRYCVLIDQGESNHHERWPKTGWITGGVNDLANFIEHSALSESVIAKGMEILEEAISQSANLLVHECYDRPRVMEEIAEKLKQKNNEQTLRMAMAILINAIYFHSTIASTYNLKRIPDIKNRFGKYSRFRILEVWEQILNEINYWPIFKIAREIMVEIPEDVAVGVLERLIRASLDLVTVGATSQHDLSGRMFQRLITDRKFLATFYTLPSSAMLLAEIAIENLELDWSNIDAISKLKIGDFACGTGALLNAAYSSVMTRFRRISYDDEKLHSQMLEKAIVGTDIMPAATHLTASILSSAFPSTKFKNTLILTLPYGKNEDISGETISLGALDLINSDEVLPLFITRQERVQGTRDADSSNVSIPHSSFDLVIMNPPFTRPGSHEANTVGTPVPAFAGFSTSDDVQREMSKKLSSFRRPNMVGHGNAGLASYFIDIANAKVKDNGTVALVLPSTFASGKSWLAARKMFTKYYEDIILVSIASVGLRTTSFSADTAISEVLLIGRKKKVGAKFNSAVTYINIERRPKSILEASQFAKEIGKIDRDKGVGSLYLGSKELFGYFIRSEQGFTGSAGVRDVDVVKFSCAISNGKLQLPVSTKIFDLPVTKLENLGDRGIYFRDIDGPQMSKDGKKRGPFDLEDIKADTVPSFPMLWAHNARLETKMIMKPDKEGRIRSGQDNEAKRLWENYASKLCFNRDFGFGSQPLSACMASTKVLGGRAWIGFLSDNKQYEIPIVLWANSSIGLILHWWTGSRQQPGRSMLTITKLCSLPVFDVRKFSKSQFEMAENIFDEYGKLDFLPANEAYRDDVRMNLDRAVLIDLLELPESILDGLDLLRRKWCSEPSVHGGKSTNPFSTQPVL